VCERSSTSYSRFGAEINRREIVRQAEIDRRASDKKDEKSEKASRVNPAFTIDAAVASVVAAVAAVIALLH
jgi:hypothetical protein